MFRNKDATKNPQFLYQICIPFRTAYEFKEKKQKKELKGGRGEETCKTEGEMINRM
jgi:hypothetical protein